MFLMNGRDNMFPSGKSVIPTQPGIRWRMNWFSAFCGLSSSHSTVFLLHNNS